MISSIFQTDRRWSETLNYTFVTVTVLTRSVGDNGCLLISGQNCFCLLSEFCIVFKFLPVEYSKRHCNVTDHWPGPTSTIKLNL